MKYFGFIKEHDDEKYADSIKRMIMEENTENTYREDVLKYLKKGKLCVPFMGCVEDANNPKFNTDDYDDDDFIAYRAVLTDGEWLWPEYIVSYLEKYPTIKINQDFINHVLKNKDKEITLSQEEIMKIENDYYKFIGFIKEE